MENLIYSSLNGFRGMIPNSAGKRRKLKFLLYGEPDLQAFKWFSWNDSKFSRKHGKSELSYFVL